MRPLPPKDEGQRVWLLRRLHVQYWAKRVLIQNSEYLQDSKILQYFENTNQNYVLQFLITPERSEQCSDISVLCCSLVCVVSSPPSGQMAFAVIKMKSCHLSPNLYASSFYLAMCSYFELENALVKAERDHQYIFYTKPPILNKELKLRYKRNIVRARELRWPSQDWDPDLGISGILNPALSLGRFTCHYWSPTCLTEWTLWEQ